MSERARFTADGLYVDWKEECEYAWEALRSMCQDEEEFEQKLKRPYPMGLHQESVTEAFSQYTGRLEEIDDATVGYPTDEAKALNEKARKYLDRSFRK